MCIPRKVPGGSKCLRSPVTMCVALPRRAHSSTLSSSGASAAPRNAPVIGTTCRNSFNSCTRAKASDGFIVSFSIDFSYTSSSISAQVIPLIKPARASNTQRSGLPPQPNADRRTLVSKTTRGPVNPRATQQRNEGVHLHPSHPSRIPAAGPPLAPTARLAVECCSTYRPWTQ